MKNRKFWSAIALSTCLLGAASCVDAEIDDALAYEDTYNNVEDADKHIIGVYSEFMKLSEQLVVLNELRGDLMDITDHSNTYLQEVDAKVDNPDNPYLNPTPFYSVIKECNDCLANFDIMLKNHDMTEDEYNERYSDIAALRCYVYLQMATHFGEVPYVTEPVVSIEDMKNVAKTAPKYDLTQLIPNLIAVMESLPFLEPYEESPLVYDAVNGTQTTLSGERLSYYFIHKKLLLADLYLWNNDFRKAAKLYKEVMDRDSHLAVTSNHLFAKCSVTDNASLGDYYQSTLSRFMYADVNSFDTNWPRMFSDALTTKAATYEWIWTISYPEGTIPQYPFVKLFASTSEGGQYQLKPSEACLYNFNRLDKTRRNDAPYDTRGDSATFHTTLSGDVVCSKYLYMYDPAIPYEQEGRWWLYRAPMIHLRFAEAVNRMGYPDLAFAFITEGLTNHYGLSYPSGVTRGCDPTEFPTDGSNIFHLTLPITMGVCDNEEDSLILYFDTRYVDASANAFEGIYRRGPWRGHQGLRRGRACMNPCFTSDFSTMTLADCATKEDSIYLVEKIILDEAALELAHEGNRFPDLVRVSRRMNTTTTTSVNGQTYVLTNDGMDGDAYFQAVMDRKGSVTKNVLGAPDYSAGESSWYLPFY